MSTRDTNHISMQVLSEPVLSVKSFAAFAYASFDLLSASASLDLIALLSAANPRSFNRTSYATDSRGAPMPTTRWSHARNCSQLSSSRLRLASTTTSFEARTSRVQEPAFAALAHVRTSSQLSPCMRTSSAASSSAMAVIRPLSYGYANTELTKLLGLQGTQMQTVLAARKGAYLVSGTCKRAPKAIPLYFRRRLRQAIRKWRVEENVRHCTFVIMKRGKI
mmetsp:Transcript_58260/g.126535  ORF Transcript_58260/g.126535 Transcript_58260/m.126535 type:complete len:221 (-) Transcript_58260:447-1109(-)